jgi:thiol-disulfide isomerase/thioredoxin
MNILQKNNRNAHHVYLCSLLKNFISSSIISIFFLYNISAQNVKISGFINNPKSEIKISPPFLNNFNSIVFQELQIKNQVFSYTIQGVSESSIACLDVDNKLMYLLVTPNDSINLYFENTHNTKKKINVECELYSRNFKNINAIQNLIDDCFTLQNIADEFNSFNGNKKYTSNEECLAKSSLFISEKNKYIDSLCLVNKLDSQITEIIKSGFINALIGSIHVNLGFYFFEMKNPKEADYHTGIIIDLYEMNKSMIMKNLFKTPMSGAIYSSYLIRKYRDQLDTVPEESLVFPVFMEWTGIKTHYFVEKKYQPKMWADELLASKTMFPFAVDYTLAYKKYCKLYPESPYIPLLKENLQIKDAKELNPTIFIDTLRKSNSFKELFDSHFAGKNKRVFIDLWATWCGPCKSSFKFGREFYLFFKENNIEYLYLSIDKPEKYKQWKEEAEAYGLEGYHALANKKFQKDLDKLFFKGFVSIPRYILIDENGNVLIEEALNPNTGYKLKEQIKAVLKI